MTNRILSLKGFHEFEAECQNLEMEISKWSKEKPEARFIHSSNGAEFAAYIITTFYGDSPKYALYYRWHAWALGLGTSSAEILNTIKSIPKSNRYYGPMCVRSHSSIIDCNPIIGAQVPISVGAAMREDGGLTICSFGDGALSTGVVFECLNILFVIEDNKRAVSSLQEKYLSCAVSKVAECFGLPYVKTSSTKSDEEIERLSEWLKKESTGSRIIHFVYNSAVKHCNAMQD